MSYMARMDRDQAEALQARFWRGVTTWIAVGGIGILFAVALLFASLPLGHALGDGARAGLELATMWMGVSLVVLTASTGGPVIAISARWLNWQDRLAEAGRVLAEPAPTAPEWGETDRRLRVCLDRTEDPEVRAALVRLHTGLQHEVRLAAAGGRSSDAAQRARDLLCATDLAARRLLTTGRRAELRDALALLDAHAEVDSTDLGRMDQARAMAARRRRQGT